ncbi:hypothetical protein EPN90_01185 [Patescibacteria group bacterium]|nr:MAG: hypothetical protein EPN90_01185 [Patescibacteria group bacterium]
MPTKKEKMKYWKLLALLGGAILIAVIAGLAIAAASFLSVPKRVVSPGSNAKVSSTTLIDSLFKDARFFEFDSSHGGMALVEDAYLYQLYGAPILKYVGHYQPGLTMRLQDRGYGNVVVIETPDETESYINGDTGEYLATYRSYTMQEFQVLFANKSNILVKLVGSCVDRPETDGELTSLEISPLSKTILIPKQDRVPVRCTRVVGGETRYGAVPGGPMPYGYKSAVMDPEAKELHVSVGQSILTISLSTSSTGTPRVVLEPTRLITPADGGFTLRAPVSVPICLGSEGGPTCERYPGGDWFEPEPNEYVGGFIGLNPSASWGGEHSFEVVTVRSALSESGAEFGKRSLALNKQYGDKDAIYSDEADTTVDGAPAFTFIAKGAFVERGGSWGEQGFRDNLSFPESVREGELITRPIRVIYFDHGGYFFRIKYAVDDDVADRIMRSWKWLPKKNP